jgi:hypothetical protein
MKTQAALYVVRDPSTHFTATMKTQGALYVVRDPPTLFPATMKTQGAIYAVRDPPTLFAATMKTQEAFYPGQGSFYTHRSNYENSGSTLRGSGILLHSSQQL